MAATSYLTPTQRYATGALFGLALNQAHFHQTHPLGLSTDDFPSDSDRTPSKLEISDDPNLWVHEHHALLRPVFKYLDIDPAAWSGLEETAVSSSVSRHVGPLLRLLSEESGDDYSERSDKELALSGAVDAMVLSMESNSESLRSRREKLREYEHQCREKFLTSDVEPNSEKLHMQLDTKEETGTPFHDCEEPHQGSIHNLCENNKKHGRRRKGYDARHRVTLRLLATWLDIKWSKMEAIETIVASSAMAFIKEQESSKQGTQSKENKGDKWKKGCIIGAAALTGGTLMAITGGLAAPAIAAGLGALAPTLGTLIPVIGASGFAAAATAAGHVAVAASFGAAGAGLSGTKMARRVGGVDEFEFKVIGENHNQGLLGVEIMISGFVFEDEDFIRPWEGMNDNLERSDKAGKLLAEVLLGGLQGNRPVTLVGYSLGARVIFKCLECLAETKNSAELVERVVLLGAPIAIRDEKWETVRKMVAGRFINAYSSNDWMLGIAFRASLLSQGLAGIQPVDIPGIQNVNVTDHVEGHSSYLWATQPVLDELQLDSYYPVLT
ncbi:hypothetical protein VIGAN_10156300 [Vigna angularis var. angularis]|uniref:DUF726 domain-containing protein n=1 Tax=Vigna angularis var. angularis TaxID=157739 RepID=A0A0S3T477_PHAAN|nr:hypothetical protein VIGAN_10156300 [Vigna angularis var. angularis]